MARYKDYLKEAVAEEKMPRPYWPKIGLALKIRKTSSFTYRNSWFGRLFAGWKLEIWWCLPKRAGYVERYCLESMATFIGWARRRHLYCIDKWWGMRWRYQSQEKFYPIEGHWEFDYAPTIRKTYTRSRVR